MTIQKSTLTINDYASQEHLKTTEVKAKIAYGVLHTTEVDGETHIVLPPAPEKHEKPEFPNLLYIVATILLLVGGFMGMQLLPPDRAYAAYGVIAYLASVLTIAGSVVLFLLLIAIGNILEYLNQIAANTKKES